MPRTNLMILSLTLGIVLGTVLALASPASRARLHAIGKDEGANALDPKAMDTIGLLSSLYFYQAHLNLGMIADCQAEGVYDKKQAKELVMSLLVPLEAVEKRLSAIAKTASKEDRATLDQWAKFAVPLRRQGAELMLFWESGDKEHAARYQATRKEAWDGLRAMLGLSDKATKQGK